MWFSSDRISVEGSTSRVPGSRVVDTGVSVIPVYLEKSLDGNTPDPGVVVWTPGVRIRFELSCDPLGSLSDTPRERVNPSE